MFYVIFRFIFWIVFRLGFRVKVENRSIFPRRGPFILASNHCSNIDPILLGITCPRLLAFLAKQELFNSRIFAFFLRRVGVIPLRRGKTDVFAVRSALAILRHDKPLVIFPQGRRDAAIDTAFNGVGFLYRMTGVPIIAAKITGSDVVLPKGAKWLKRAPLQVSFQPVDTVVPADDYTAITRKVLEKIRSM